MVKPVSSQTSELADILIKEEGAVMESKCTVDPDPAITSSTSETQESL